jgi:putative DNA primase/helicase
VSTSHSSRAELETQARGIVEQLGGKWSARGGMCRCPAHDDSSPSLSVRLGDTTLLFHCFAGCATIDVLSALRALGSTGVLTTRESIRVEKDNLQPLAERLWRDSRRLPGSLAASYLASRHIISHSAQLRFHSSVQLGSGGGATFHPAMIAAVRDDSGLVAVHRTFLHPVSGLKAAFDNPKRLLAVPGRGAVRIGEATCVLGIAEGIETALAASKIHGFPVWAVLGNERFGLVSIPKCVERLIVLADNDAGGARAAKLAVEGLQRDALTIETVWPPSEHNDWADVLMASGGEGAAPN